MRKEGSLEKGFYGTITVGERGQVVIPADARKDYGIEPGDKLLLFRHPGPGGLTMVKLDCFTELVEHFNRIQELSREHAEKESA